MLAPAGEQNPSDRPYRTAELTIDNRGDGLIWRVELREAAGGPTFVLPVSVAPGAKRTFRLPLPAVSVQQSYDLAAIGQSGREGDVAARSSCPIVWPAAMVSAEEVIDPAAYRPWQEELPAWPRGLVRNVFAAAALACLALTATMIFRRPVVRAVAAMVVVAAATIGTWELVRRAETVIRVDDPAGGLVVLRCRRSADWRAEGERMVPIYSSGRQMAEDRSRILLGGAAGERFEIEVPLRPDEVRILRRQDVPAD